VGDGADEVRQPDGKQSASMGSGTKTTVTPKIVYQENVQNVEDISQVFRRGRGRPRRNAASEQK
jgi:hypothetical protein